MCKQSRGGADSAAPFCTPAKLGTLMTVFLLAGGILLDFNRINSVRDTLNRVASVAAVEAAAAPKGADRSLICQKRFAHHVWTDTEVSVDDVSVNVSETRTSKIATVGYDATVTLVVGRFFGIPQLEISGETEVSIPNRATVASVP